MSSFLWFKWSLESADTEHLFTLTLGGNSGAPLLVSHALPTSHPLEPGTYLVALSA